MKQESFFNEAGPPPPPPSPLPAFPVTPPRKSANGALPLSLPLLTNAAHRKNTVLAMICESYMIYLSEQLSWRPLQEDSMQISCADNPASQRIEIRKLI